MQEEAQGTGHTPKGLTDTSKQPSTKAPPCPFPQPQARVPCPHTLAGPEIHHPTESLSTCWVTKGHPPHWVWMSYQGAWLVPGVWPLLCLLLGYVTGSQACPVSATQVSQPTQPLPPGRHRSSTVWVGCLSKKGLQALLPLEAEGACLVARGENTLLPACLGNFTHARTRATGRKSPVTRQQCWTTSHQFSSQQGPHTTGTQEGPTDVKHTCRFLQGGFCSSQ